MSIETLTDALAAELRHAARESQYSAGRSPTSYGAGYDAGWAEALRWVLKTAISVRTATGPAA
jgi:hypothetical protein